jgi:hypothetical protein
MRHDKESCDQGGEDQDKAWLDGPVTSVKGKLSDDLASMDRSNGEEQVRSRSITNTARDDMKRIISFMIGWCMCCINIRGDGMECARQRYNLGYFISPIIGI